MTQILWLAQRVRFLEESLVTEVGDTKYMAKYSRNRSIFNAEKVRQETGATQTQTETS
jgi:hypothetical protein